MTNEVDISITGAGEHKFRVQTLGPGGSTTHTVEVPRGLADELGWTDDEEDLVRQSFDFLLEREPPSSILRSFSLEVIGRYFPDYPREIRRSAREA